MAHSWLGLLGHFGWMALFYIFHTKDIGGGIKQLCEQLFETCCQYETRLIYSNVIMG